MKFVNYLQDKDLKAIMKSKDVPTAVIATHARRIADEEGKDLMAKVSSRDAQVNARIVYWGVEGAGKTHEPRTRPTRKLRPDHRGEMRARADAPRSVRQLRGAADRARRHRAACARRSS